jgi:hypothetical protein
MPADQRQALDMGQLLPGDLGRGALKQAVETICARRAWSRFRVPRFGIGITRKPAGFESLVAARIERKPLAIGHKLASGHKKGGASVEPKPLLHDLPAWTWERDDL